MNDNENISQARGGCLVAAPYYARGLFRLRFEAAPDRVATAGVTAAWRCLYNPAYFAGLSPAERVGVIMHEFSHVLGMHHARMRDRTAMFTNGCTVWNAAGDVIINEGLRAGGFTLGPGALFRDMINPPIPERCGSVEDVYDYLLLNTPEDGGGGCGEGDLLAGDEPEGDEELIAKQVAADVLDYVKANPGQCPRDVEMWANEQLAPPHIRWEDILRGRVNRVISSWIAGQDLPTFGRRSRRQEAVGGRIVLSGRVRPVPHVCIIADTSGSMGGSGAVVMSEVLSIARTCGGVVRVIAADAIVQGDGRVGSIRALKGVMRGGGGTDMNPAFALARKDGEACIVCITDGYMPPVDDRAIWLIVPCGERAGWMKGSVVVYDDGGKRK